MWLCAMPALGLPTPKRLPETLALPKHREEVLAGRDFLSVFMRTSSSRSAARQQLGQPAAIGNGGGGSDFSENSNSVQQLHRVEGVEQRYTDINQKGEGVLEATDYAEEFESARNFNSRDRFTEDRHPLDASPTTTPSPGGAPSQAQTVTDAPATTTTETPSTTTPASEPEEEAAVSSFYDLDEENPSEIGIGGLADVARTEPSFASYWARFTEKAPSTPPAATPSADANDQPLQVISVRVSSSVVRHSHKVDDHSTPKPFESEKLIKTASRLVTQEQPTLTAVQRSSLNVEEGPLIEGQNYAPYRPALPIAPAAQHPPSPETQSQVIPMQTSTTVPPPQTSVPPNLHNLGSSFGVRNLQKPASQTNGFSEHQPSDGVQHNSAHQSSADYHNSPEALAAVQEEINVQRTDFLKLKETKPENHTHKVNRYDLENKPRSDDDDGVNKYNVKDYGLFSKQDEKEKQVGDGVRSYDNEPKALAYHYDPQNPQLSPVSYQTSVSSATSGSRVRFYSEPLGYRKASQRQTLEQQRAAAPAGYEQPERVYGVPEQNYEVDEAVSVVTNGRTHGVQGPAPAPPSPPPSVRQGPGDSEDPNKSGYVLEGRNFRKYRVEEKTADGFIVGEYGVVSHDDGSLRGVRYTADSTINPRLIYDALVKFLSLK